MVNHQTIRESLISDQGLTETEQLDQLAKDGWPQAALDVYQAELKRMRDTGLANQQATVMRLWFDAHRVGSDLFSQMFFKNYHPSQAQAQSRIQLLENILGFQLDDTNFVQMTRLGIWHERITTPSLYYFMIGDASQAKSYTAFVGKVARLMYAKYQVRSQRFFGRPSMTMLDEPIDHQLRYYLGKPMIDWVRYNQMTPTDLIHFSEKYLNRKVRYPDAQYHNRGVIDQTNQKIVFNDYHLEFIFNQSNQIVSIWNALEQHRLILEDGSVRFNQDVQGYTQDELQAVANTESFNYAKHGGTVHDLLDGDPSVRQRGYEPNLRDYAKTLF